MATSAPPAMKRIDFDGFDGSMRSRTADQVPHTHIADPVAGTTYSYNMDYLPRNRSFKRRGGQMQKFDTFGSSVGLLPAKWGSTYPGRARQMDEFPGALTGDGIASVCAMVTKERIDTANYLDDGRFSTLYMRDQYNSVNYTLGDEFGDTTYPDPGTTQTYRYVPVWNNGHITRGPDEFQRRLMLGDPRSFLRVGNWYYAPGGPHGCPVRFDMEATPGAALTQTGNIGSDSGLGGIAWSLQGGASTVTDALASADGTKFVRFTAGVGGDGAAQGATVESLSDPGIDTGFRLKFTVKSSTNTNCRMQITLGNTVGGGVFSDRYIGFSGNTGQTTTAELGNCTTSFAEYTVHLSDAECASVNFASTLVVQFLASGLPGSSTFDIDEIEFVTGTASVGASHLIPSGPIPPTHCGYITTGDAVAGSDGTTYAYPDADTATVGSWYRSGVDTGAYYSQLTDQSSSLDTEYIQINFASNNTIDLSLADLGFSPDVDDAVSFRWRAITIDAGGTRPTMTVSLVKDDGTTVYASATHAHDPAWRYQSRTLTPTEISTTTSGAGWDNLRLRFTTSGGSGIGFIRVSWAAVASIASGTTADGGWHGADRFPFALAYEFEDGSVWMPTTPRFPNDNLPDGLGIYTVDAANPATRFKSITWHIAVPPKGVRYVSLLRGNKIDSTTDDNLQMNLRDLREVWKVDAGVTTYEDFAADDDALAEDVDGLRVRLDHIMPPRARWIFGGDSRIAHSYGGLNPCAVTLAPVGFTADWDLTLPDDSSTAYSANASYYQVATDALYLFRDDGTNVTSKTFAFSTYPTIGELVDAINATSTSDGDWSNEVGSGTLSAQWRAQVLHGEQAATTALCPTVRSIASCVVSGQSITKAAGGLSDVPVGAYIQGTSGGYVSKVVSDTQLTYVGSGAASGTLVFVSGTGDSITGGTNYDGYVRVIANSLPGFLFFTTDYLDQFPIEKDAVWITVGNPESNKAAANCFSGGESNKFRPPVDVGMSMGGFAVGNSFRTPFYRSLNGRILNERDSGTGLDKDYRIYAEPDEGCHGPVVQGPDCGFIWGPHGWYVADKYRRVLISGDIWNHSPATGDFSYEAPLCSAAAAADTDTAHMHAKVMRGAFYVNYRASGSLPNRQVKYDFAGDLDSSGLAAVLRPDGRPYGWGTPRVVSFTAMCAGTRSDGEHSYGWSEANAGSTGDGRIDEFETGDDDNGTAITASAYTPLLTSPTTTQISGQAVEMTHSAPTGSTGSRTFTRSLAGDAYTGTPGTNGSLPVTEDWWDLPVVGARVASARCYIGYHQATGGARELRSMTLHYVPVNDTRPGQAG